MRLQHGGQIGAFAELPTHDQMGFLLRAFFCIHRIGVRCVHWGGEGRFERDLDFSLQRIKTLQHLCLKNVLVRFGADVAKGEEYRVAGVVVLGVEVPQLLVTQIRDVLRVAAAVEVVGVGRKQLVAQPIPQDRRGGGHGALHLVEYDTLEYQRLRTVVVLKLYSVSFLCEVERVQSRKEHGIEINI